MGKVVFVFRETQGSAGDARNDRHPPRSRFARSRPPALKRRRTRGCLLSNWNRGVVLVDR